MKGAYAWQPALRKSNHSEQWPGRLMIEASSRAT